MAKDSVKQYEILNETVSSKVKKLGKAIPDPKGWEDDKLEWARKIALSKLAQSHSFYVRLRATGTAKIEHSVSSSWWGTGRDKNGNKGANHYGHLLEEIRDRFVT